GYNAIADDWIGIRPGTDGLFVFALIHELLKAGRVDLDYLLRYTNAHVLVIQEPGAADDGLFARDSGGNPLAWDYSWDAPLAAHGLMHTVIRNAWAGDPYRIDTLMMYMSNMAWNSSMNTVETMAMLTDMDASGEYRIPFIIYSDAYYSETVPFADLVLPDTTYLERHDCISLLDRPISHADGPGDAIRHPVVEPDRDVRAFQT
ncbi:MAG: hypothetical protein E5Y81_19915, partial [Mesorhizobium sp.]